MDLFGYLQAQAGADGDGYYGAPHRILARSLANPHNDLRHDLRLELRVVREMVRELRGRGVDHKAAVGRAIDLARVLFLMTQPQEEAPLTPAQSCCGVKRVRSVVDLTHEDENV